MSYSFRTTSVENQRVASDPAKRASGVRRLLVGLSCAAALSVNSAVYATGLPQGMPGEVKDNPVVSPFLQDIGIDQHLGAELPKDAVFTDDNGRTVQLGDLFGQKPAILVMVYYECPQLCTMVLNQLVRTMNGMTALNAGEDFNVICVSIDPGENAEMAAKKKRAYLKEYGKRGNPAGWHFLTGNEENIKRVAETVGFRYRYDPKYDEYMHASGITVATTDGRMSRYFYGIEYNPTDLRMSLGDASQGKIGGLVKVVLDYCLRYDPMTGKYGPDIMNLLRAFGVVTVLSLGTFMFVMFRRDRRGQGPAALPPAGKPAHS